MIQKSLLSAAVGAALFAPAALTALAVTAPAGPAEAAQKHVQKRVHGRAVVKRNRIKPVRISPVRIRPGALKPGLVQPKICMVSRKIVFRDLRALQNTGYHRVRLVGHRMYPQRCARFFYISACKGLSLYRITVRYIKLRRTVSINRTGICPHILRPTPRLGS